MTTATGDVTYLLLADRASPYLLARVRWPDVAQAITMGSPDWLDDPGLFDLPYDQSAVTVSFPQAASVAAAWGRQLRPEPDTSAPSFIRRMPANWSDLSAAERRALGIESVGKRRISASARRRLSRLTGVAANGDGSRGAERHTDLRVRVDGRALIRAGELTISAGLVEVSEGGMECVLPEARPMPAPGPEIPEARPMLAPGAELSGPFLLEIQGTTAQICLDVPGWISWHRSTGSITHLGIAFGELSDAQTEGVRRFLASALGRGSR